MAGGLLALLDDVAALVKVTAATLDDIPAQVAKTGSKVTGVVIDDAAVTPKYVVGLSPKRELAIIWKIARASLINKLAFIGPAVLLLGYFAPWAITPILMLGGSYLCFEGYEKIHSMLAHHAEAEETPQVMTPEQLEKERVSGAVRTDLILSAEIMVIAYGTIEDKPFLSEAIILFCVAIAITAGVYGFVGLLVKMDDIGVYLAKTSRYAAIRALGRGLVKGMPPFLKILGLVGTAAMLWVGGEIVAHGIPAAHHALDALKHALGGTGALPWFGKALASAVGGLVLGGIIATLLQAGAKLLPRTKKE
jgi:predicted DNA repair protein MutK